MANSDKQEKTEPSDEHKNNSDVGVEEDEHGIDEAVNEIERTEADDELKLQDAAKPVVMKQGLWERLKNAQANWWSNPRKKWGSVLGIVLVLVAVFAVPFTRDEIVGLLIREKVTVQVVDSKTGTPVSGAQVSLGAEHAETDGDGKAVLYPHAGSRHLQVSKQYYIGTEQSVLVTLSPSSNMFDAKLVALGRQVQVKVINKITTQPVANAEVTIGKASARTNEKGLTTVVLPSSADTQTATVSLNGYNNAAVSIDASGDLAKDTFSITPAGKLYFLSNLSGTIDVVKTNLDGTDRQTVLAGTGSEDPNDTSLLASRDWKYLALLSKRSGNNASVYLIDTTNNDKLTTIDEGNANFTLIGWSNDRLIYLVDRSPTVPAGQAGQEVLKSFDPTTGQTLLLDQTTGATYTFNPGQTSSGFIEQNFGNVYLIGSDVVYVKNWDGQGYSYVSTNPLQIKAYLDGKTAELDSIGADGSNHKTLQTFTPSQQTYSDMAYNSNVISYITVGSQAYEPQAIDLVFTDSNTHGSTTTYYEYEDGKVTTDATPPSDSDATYGTYPTYLLSPSGNSTFWSEPRDGQNTLFTGDDDAESPKQIASLSAYSPYGWYTDNYLLVSQNSSELYIMPVGGDTPLKITDYYKPPINYQGYGGGYGGL
ncbi:MAG TPA: hypothetical protein VMB52_02110 [Verrucomicrobiae bacterium]|nr:hypothetical protein [Verrucomicrobiae bacterium]